MHVYTHMNEKSSKTVNLSERYRIPTIFYSFKLFPKISTIEKSLILPQTCKNRPSPPHPILLIIFAV